MGVLHLAEYSVLTTGPEVSRKSKFAFRLSSLEPIPHQHQHHVFYTESAQSLHNWVYALEVHISHAIAAWASTISTTAGHGLQLADQRSGAGQSIIDRVLDRLHLDESPDSNSSSIATSSPRQQSARVNPSGAGAQSGANVIPPYFASNFPQSHEDNNDTWSSTSSIPQTSTNTSTNLEYIFALNQQHGVKSSMDSVRDLNHPAESMPQYGGGVGYQAGSGFTDNQSNISDPNRSSLDYQGRTSLQQSRGLTAGAHGFHAGSSSVNSFLHQQQYQHPQSPSIYPTRSAHSALFTENGIVPFSSDVGFDPC